MTEASQSENYVLKRDTECFCLLDFPSLSCSSKNVKIGAKSSLQFPKWIVSKSHNTNTLKRNIFMLLFCSVPSSTFLSTRWAGTGPEEQKWRGAVHLLHLLPSPHWACPGSLEPHPAIPTSHPAKPQHRSSICRSTSLPVLQLDYPGCCPLCLCVGITFFTQVPLSNWHCLVNALPAPCSLSVHIGM